MPRLLLRIALLAAAFALGTVAVGWLAVPVVALVWGAVDRSRWPARNAAAGAAVGWGVLLGAAGLTGPAGDLARMMGGVLGVPSWMLVVLTILFPAAVAASGAYVAAAARARALTKHDDRDVPSQS